MAIYDEGLDPVSLLGAQYAPYREIQATTVSRGEFNSGKPGGGKPWTPEEIAAGKGPGGGPTADQYEAEKRRTARIKELFRQLGSGDPLFQDKQAIFDELKSLNGVTQDSFLWNWSWNMDEDAGMPGGKSVPMYLRPIDASLRNPRFAKYLNQGYKSYVGPNGEIMFIDDSGRRAAYVGIVGDYPPEDLTLVDHPPPPGAPAPGPSGGGKAGPSNPLIDSLLDSLGYYKKMGTLGPDVTGLKDDIAALLGGDQTRSRNELETLKGYTSKYLTPRAEGRDSIVEREAALQREANQRAAQSQLAGMERAGVNPAAQRASIYQQGFSNQELSAKTMIEKRKEQQEAQNALINAQDKIFQNQDKIFTQSKEIFGAYFDVDKWDYDVRTKYLTLYNDLLSRGLTHEEAIAKIKTDLAVEKAKASAASQKEPGDADYKQAEIFGNTWDKGTKTAGEAWTQYATSEQGSKPTGSGGKTSDERAKQNIAPANPFDIWSFLGSIAPKQFEYQPGVPGEVPGQPQIGVTAQDLERTPLGQQMVSQDPATGYKKIDPNEALPALLASLGALNQKVQAQDAGNQAAMSLLGGVPDSYQQLMAQPAIDPDARAALGKLKPQPALQQRPFGGLPAPGPSPLKPMDARQLELETEYQGPVPGLDPEPPPPKPTERKEPSLIDRWENQGKRPPLRMRQAQRQMMMNTNPVFAKRQEEVTRYYALLDELFPDADDDEEMS